MRGFSAGAQAGPRPSGRQTIADATTVWHDAHVGAPLLNDDERAAWRTLLAAHARVTERVEADLAAAGLPSIAWYDVLYSLYLADGRRLRMFELADAIIMSRSGLTRLVDRLEARGLLARRTCPSDRRGQFVVLEEAGVDALREMWPVYAASIRRRYLDLLDDPASVAAALGPVADAAATTAAPAGS